MNLLNIQETTATSRSDISSYKHKSEVDSSETNSSKRLCYSPPTRRQNWSLPDSIIYYMAKNPKTSQLYQKMIQSCKYFFYKNPIIICSDFSFDSGDVWGDFEEEDDSESDFEETINESQIRIEQDGTKIALDMNNISYKFWITDSFYTDAYDNVITTINSHIYQCDAKKLELWNQKMSLNEYMFIAVNAEDISLNGIIVEKDDGSAVPLEKIIEVSVNASMFDIDDEPVNITSETVKYLLKIPHFLNMKIFAAGRVPGDSFDIETFYNYLKKNKQTNFVLHLTPISEQLKIRLDKIGEEIIALKFLDFKVPCFLYDGQDEEQAAVLKEIFYLSCQCTF